jgi:Caspase domain
MNAKTIALSIITLFLFSLGTYAQEKVVEAKSKPVRVTLKVPEKVVVEDVVKPVLSASELQNMEFKILRTDMGISKVPKNHALIIGVSKYQHAPDLNNLPNAFNDAKKLYSVLATKYEFESENMKLLENPTKDEILDQFDRLEKDVDKNDNVLIFYAGHGIKDEDKNEGYWQPADAKKGASRTWISNSDVMGSINAIKSLHTFLIVDACFGGTIILNQRGDGEKFSSEKAAKEEAELKLNEERESKINRKAMQFNQGYKKGSRKAMTSGSAIPVSDESKFLKYLIKSLEDIESPVFSDMDLFSNLLGPVSENSDAAPQIGKMAKVDNDGGNFYFFKRIEAKVEIR